MRLLGLSGVIRGAPHRTTIADKTASRAPGLLNQDFTGGTEPEGATDFTYVWSRSGFVYGAFIVDVFARPGGSPAGTAGSRTLLTWCRSCCGRVTLRSRTQLIDQCDAGSQYTAIKFTRSLAPHQIRTSIDSVRADCDNA